MNIQHFYKLLFIGIVVLLVPIAFISLKKAVIIFICFYIAYAIMRVNGLLPKQSYKGKHVFITGAGSGLGKKLSILFAKSGSKVTLCDINFTSVQILEAELIQTNYIAKAIYCDVTNKEQIKKTFDEARQNFGEIDLLINNAGIVSGKLLAETTDDKIEQTFAINIVSHFYTIKQLLPEMLARNSGHIVEIASMAGIMGTAKLVDYCSSKFAVIGLYESLKCEIYKLNKDIQLTCICPFFINTGMFKGAQSPLGFLLPILNEDYVVKRIKDAIEQGEGLVFLPWICYLILVVKLVFFYKYYYCINRALLPENLTDMSMKLFGSTTYMNNFEGRKKE